MVAALTFVILVAAASYLSSDGVIFVLSLLSLEMRPIHVIAAIDVTLLVVLLHLSMTAIMQVFLPVVLFHLKVVLPTLMPAVWQWSLMDQLQQQYCPLTPSIVPYLLKFDTRRLFVEAPSDGGSCIVRVLQISKRGDIHSLADVLSWCWGCSLKIVIPHWPWTSPSVLVESSYSVPACQNAWQSW